MNRHRFRSDMEAAWELRPHTDITPESRSHPHRFSLSGEKSHTGDSSIRESARSERNTQGTPSEKLP